jgi:hypothetical protein
MKIYEVYVREVLIPEFWKGLEEDLESIPNGGLNSLLQQSNEIIFNKFGINPNEKDKYFISGSARLFLYPKLLEAFGMASTIGDLDIVIPNQQDWINAGLENEWNQGGIYRPTQDGSIEAFNIWDPSKAGGAYASVQVRSTQDIIRDSTFINGYYFMSLMDVMDYKTALNRDKEVEVVNLINQYQSSNSGEKMLFLRKIANAIGFNQAKAFLSNIKK